MTVGELIELLKAQDPDVEVVIEGGCCGGQCVSDVKGAHPWTNPSTGKTTVTIEAVYG